MIKRPTLRRPTVELDPAARPSRIRREPPPLAERTQKKALQAYPTEREMWTVVIGVILFALAITVAIVGSSNNLFN